MISFRPNPYTKSNQPNRPNGHFEWPNRSNQPNGILSDLIDLILSKMDIFVDLYDRWLWKMLTKYEMILHSEITIFSYFLKLIG